jgi:hypothetical protein
VKGFTCTVQKNGNRLDLQMVGEISIDSELPRLDLREVTELNLDLSGVKYINSAGIRKWMTWFRTSEQSHPELVFLMNKLPVVLVSQMKNVLNFIPERSKIQSVFVCYYCEDCDVVAEKLLEKGQQFGPGVAENDTIKHLSEMTCPKCIKMMDVDGNPGLYVDLFKRYG